MYLTWTVEGTTSPSLHAGPSVSGVMVQVCPVRSSNSCCKVPVNRRTPFGTTVGRTPTFPSSGGWPPCYRSNPAAPQLWGGDFAEAASTSGPRPFGLKLQHLLHTVRVLNHMPQQKSENSNANHRGYIPEGHGTLCPVLSTIIYQAIVLRTLCHEPSREVYPPLIAYMPPSLRYPELQ